MSSPRSARYPFPWWVFALVLAFSLAPITSAIAGAYIGEAAGCKLSAADVHPCEVLGVDLGEPLYMLFMMHWLAMGTVPTGLGALAIMAIVNFFKWYLSYPDRHPNP